AYEERFLFLLLLLRQPRARLIYVTSQSILPSTVDYYLGLLPGVIASHARSRLFLVSPQDRSPRPLTVKLLERPHLIERIHALIADRTDPKFLAFGTKSGSRRLFVEEGIPHPAGRENIQVYHRQSKIRQLPCTEEPPAC